jgi:hypothetical protein
MRLVVVLTGTLLLLAALGLLVHYAALFQTGVDLPRAESFGHVVGGGERRR